MSNEVVDPPSTVAAAEVGVHRVPLPARGDRRRGPPVHAVLDELVPSAWHHVEQYANNPIEAGHSRLKQRLRPMHGPRTDSTAQVIIAGHALIQNLRRGHHELGVGLPPSMPLAAALTELGQAI